LGWSIFFELFKQNKKKLKTKKILFKKKKKKKRLVYSLHPQIQ